MTSVDFKLPATFNGRPIPGPEDVDDMSTSAVGFTARVFHEAKPAFTSKVAKVFERDSCFELKRLLSLRPRQTKNGMQMPALNVARPQGADSIIKYMYGEIQVDEDACDHCSRGNGPYSDYVLLTEVSEGCASCHYTGSSNKCSLNSKHARQTTAEPSRKRQLEMDPKESHKKIRICKYETARECWQALDSMSTNDVQKMAGVLEFILVKRQMDEWDSDR